MTNVYTQTGETRARVRAWLALPEDERPSLRELALECEVTTQRMYQLLKKVRREQEEGAA